MSTQICKFSQSDPGYCETHAVRFDGLDVSSETVELNGGQDVLLGEDARRYRQALRHTQEVLGAVGTPTEEP